MKERKYFCVGVYKYCKGKTYNLYRPASLNYPKDNSVMFVTKPFLYQAKALDNCCHCMVFWPKDIDIPIKYRERHVIIPVREPRSEYCKFFKENNIKNLPHDDEVRLQNGSYISKHVRFGKNSTIFPGAYIGRDVVIGDNVYIGSGVRITGIVEIGDNVVIRENSVIGADGLSTNRDDLGRPLDMPQFGGVEIKDNVQIGANVTICRGAIDNTIIKSNSKIDNNVFVSHNVQIGENVMIVGGAVLFGSIIVEDGAYISGNATIRDGIIIGKDSYIGMGSVVIKPVEINAIVAGNPARNK